MKTKRAIKPSEYAAKYWVGLTTVYRMAMDGRVEPVGHGATMRVRDMPPRAKWELGEKRRKIKT